MRVRFISPRFARHAEAHPELLECVPCNEYLGPPSLGIACLAAITPSSWEIEFRDDRVEDIGLDDPPDLIAISTFTASAMRAMEIGDLFRKAGSQVVIGGIFPTMRPDEVALHADAVVVGEGEMVWPMVLEDAAKRQLKPRYEASVLADLTKLPLPRVDLYLDREGPKYAPDDYPVQLSRGCPMKCVARRFTCDPFHQRAPWPRSQRPWHHGDRIGARPMQSVCLRDRYGLPRLDSERGGIWRKPMARVSLLAGSTKHSSCAGIDDAVRLLRKARRDGRKAGSLRDGTESMPST